MKRIGLGLWLALLGTSAHAEIFLTAENGITSYYTPCFPLYSLASDGSETATGITAATSNFRVSIISDNQNLFTDFETSADLETIATIGTYVSPTNATDIRFGECESEGLYQIQFHNDHMDVSGSTMITVILTDDGGSIGDQLMYIDQARATVADLNAEVDTALADINLDHLMGAAVTGAAVADNSALARLVSDDATADWDSYNNQTDSLEAQQLAEAVIDNNVDAILVDTGTSGVPIVAGGITASSFGANAITANVLDSTAANEIRDAILGATIDGSIDLQCAIALSFAYATGNWDTDAASVPYTITYRNPADSANRIVGTVASTSFSGITLTCP